MLAPPPPAPTPCPARATFFFEDALALPSIADGDGASGDGKIGSAGGGMLGRIGSKGGVSRLIVGGSTGAANGFGAA